MIILDYPGAPDVTTRVFIKGGRRITFREGDLRIEAEAGVLPLLEGP